MSRHAYRLADPRNTKSPHLEGIRFGAPERTRTSNLLIRSQMLYPLSYGRLVRGEGYLPRWLGA